MKVEYDRANDTLRIELGPASPVEKRVIGEDVHMDVDEAGGVCAIIVEHARARADLWAIGDEGVSDERLREAEAERDRAERALNASERRLRRQNAAFVDVARRMRRQGDWPSRLKAIAEASARALEVERVGVWLFSEDHSRIECVDLFDLNSGTHTAGAVVAAADFPAYFRALNRERTIAASDAHKDERTAEFSSTYLDPLGIGAMLDAPVRLGVELAGVVCHEHVGPAREWTLDEQNFAGSVADLVSLALETHVRERTERELWARGEALQHAVPLPRSEYLSSSRFISPASVRE